MTGALEIILTLLPVHAETEGGGVCVYCLIAGHQVIRSGWKIVRPRTPAVLRRVKNAVLCFTGLLES